MADQNQIVLGIVSEIKDSTSNIAADIDRTLEQIQTGGLTEDTIAQLQAASDALKAVAAKIPEPTEPETPETEA